MGNTSIDEIDEKDRLTFWRNWYEAIRFKPDPKERLEKYEALLDYVFTGKEPEQPSAEHPESANAYEIVNFVRATIAKSRAQRANGSKKKAKRSQSEAKAKPNKANAKPNEAKRKQEQEQVQDKEQEQEQDANSISATTTQPGLQRPTLKQLISRLKLAGVDDAAWVEDQWYTLEADGWRDKNGSPIANPFRYLKTIWLAEQKKICAARENAESGGLFGTGIRVAAKRKAVR